MNIKLIETIQLASDNVAIDTVKRKLAICCFRVGYSEYRFYNLDNLTTFTKLTFGNPAANRALTFNRSGKFLAAAEWSDRNSGLGWVYDITQKTHREFRMGQYQGGSWSASFSPQARFLVVSSPFIQTQIIDVNKLMSKENDWQFIEGLEGEKMSARRFFSWSPDGKMLASVTDQKNRIVDIWIFPNREDSQVNGISVQTAVYKDWGTDPTGVNERLGLDFSEDSRWLAAGGGTKNKGIVQIFDVQNNTLLCESDPLDSRVDLVKFSPSGEYLISGSQNGALTLWGVQNNDLAKLNKLDETKLPGTILAIGIEKSGQSLFLACKGKRKGLLDFFGNVEFNQVSLSIKIL